MKPAYQSSQLWVATLAYRQDDCFEQHRSRLRVAYEKFWSRGIDLAEKISSDLPDLTLHGEPHLAALWERASQLVGPNYEINPLEAFVLGGAILLHDTGHAFAAYERGINEIKETIAYSDALTAAQAYNDDHFERRDSKSDERLVKTALFHTMRKLHGQQAETLALRSFHGLYLIDDDDLRGSLAQLIGQIAASHCWDVGRLDELGGTRGAPSAMPRDWHIEPIKLACILRCADAIQIDQRRASIFPFALQNPEGFSRLHWQAQQIAQPVIESGQAPPAAIKFTSQNDFTTEFADAWWIAYDLIQIANKELGACYSLMRDLNLPVFQVDRVAGANSPERLAFYIRTTGWRPVNAEVRVTSVEQIVKLFGGEGLYGRDLSVPLRELIQNAADAVRARKFLEISLHYRGKIVLKFAQDPSSLCLTLSVMDNGIGMSQSVMTGSLLEFGKSFWKSNDAQNEFPGLISAKLRQSGRYGIGFFSTLMLSNTVRVTSRRFDTNDRVNAIVFRDGVKLRPLLLSARETDLGGFSTRVDLNVTTDKIVKMLTCSEPILHGRTLTLSYEELIAHICAGIDCDVYLEEDGRPLKLVHSEDWLHTDAKEWLRAITLADKLADPILDDYMEKASQFVRPIIYSDGQASGRAAIGFGLNRCGITIIGGLVSGQSSRSPRSFSHRFVGAMEVSSAGPQRFGGHRVPRNVDIAKWATEQADIISLSDLDLTDRYLAAQNVANYGGNPRKIAIGMINRELKALAEIYELLSLGKCIWIPVAPSADDKHKHIGSIHHEVTSAFHLGLSNNEIEFNCLTLEAWEPSHSGGTIYHSFPSADNASNGSLLGCLSQFAIERERQIIIGDHELITLAKYTGKPSDREGLLTDAPLTVTAACLALK